MKSIRNNILSIRIITFMMALNIFNLSIDTPDNIIAGEKEDLSINEQESFVELILETFIGLEDVIDEHDDSDSDQGGKIDFKKLLFQNTLSEAICSNIALNRKYILRNDILGDYFIVEKDSPPPKIG